MLFLFILWTVFSLTALLIYISESFIKWWREKVNKFKVRCQTFCNETQFQSCRLSKLEDHSTSQTQKIVKL